MVTGCHASPVSPAPLPEDAVRTATAADVPAVVALVQLAYRGDDSRAGWTTEADLLAGQRTDADEVGAVVADPGSRLLLLEVGGVLVACCALSPTGTTARVYLGMLAVDPQRQGDGLGSALMAAAQVVAVRELGARTAEMTVIAQRSELIAYYERRGWRRTGQRRPFPSDDPRFGVPLRDDLEFVVLAREL